MKHHIAMLGNCHAQYLAAALTHCFRDLDVKAVGKPFDGPITFQGTQSAFISSPELVNWLREGKGMRLVFMQTTPLANTSLQDKLDQMGIEHELILFPYIAFQALTLKRTDPKFGPALVRSRTRADEIANKICLSKAGLPETLYEKFLMKLRERPCAYTPNHFDGGLFAEIFCNADLAPLEAIVGPARMASFMAAMEADAGIPHQHVGIPLPEVSEQLGITWGDPVMSLAREKANLTFNQFCSQVGDRRPPVEYCNYITWRILINEGKATGCHLPIRKCLRMYRNRRNYVVWCRNLAEWFLSKGYPARAAVVVANRMAKDDTRGLLLQWVLDNRAAFQASPSAKKVFRAGAVKAPNSTLKLVSDIFEAIG